VEEARGPLELAALRLAVGEQPSEDLPALAAEALALGFDSPSLREAAGISRHDVREARDRFEDALAELGIEIPDRVDATWLLVRRVAQEIVDGEVSPYKGARAIGEYHNHIETDPRGAGVRIFEGLAWEWEGSPSYRFSYEARIRELAAHLLRRNELPSWERTRPLLEPPAGSS